MKKKKNKRTRRVITDASSSFAGGNTPTATAAIDENTPLYWIAINGPSAAITAVPCPLSHLTVSPTPETLLGYTTFGEQHHRQTFFLTAPMEHVEAYMEQLGKTTQPIKARTFTRPNGPLVFTPENPDEFVPGRDTAWCMAKPEAQQ